MYTEVHFPHPHMNIGLTNLRIINIGTHWNSTYLDAHIVFLRPFISQCTCRDSTAMYRSLCTRTSAYTPKES